MKSTHAWKARLGSAILAASMMMSFLPLSVITFAAGDSTSPVSVTWEPQKQTIDGSRQIELSVSLTQQSEGSSAGAMVEIALNEEEAAALQWTGASIEESVLLWCSPPDKMPF